MIAKRSQTAMLRHFPHAVYRTYDADGVLLYIGCTSEPEARRRYHRGRAHWWPRMDRWEQEWHPDYYVAREAERVAIQTEQPEFNIQWNRPRQALVVTIDGEPFTFAPGAGVSSTRAPAPGSEQAVAS